MAKTFGIDQYATQESTIHNWESRTKLVALLVLIFTFAFISEWQLLPVMAAISAVLFSLTKIPFHFLRHRLAIPSYIILGIALILPFIAGETIAFSAGPIDIRQEGVLASIIFAIRLFSIITVTVVLLGTQPFLQLMKSLRGLGLPTILADMILLSYRYLFEVGTYFNTVQTAARLRGFRYNQLGRDNIKTNGLLIGNMLVRSYEQSEQVYNAMILRGYGEEQTLHHTAIQRPDLIKCTLIILTSASLLIAQFMIRSDIL